MDGLPHPGLGMLYKLGRFLQLLGLIILPVGVAGNLVPEPKQVDLKTSLVISAVGIVVFLAGWLIQQAAGPR